jgi:hypothetical protein
VSGASCDLPLIEAVVMQSKLEERGTSQEVQLSVGPRAKMGTYQGAVIIHTNDADNPTVEVSLSVEVVSPITVRPGSFFFGFMKPGETKTATVTLTSTVPFEITDTKVDKLELITVEATKREDGAHQIKATLTAPNQPGTLEGTIEIATDLEAQPAVHIPYFVQISAAE